MARTKQTARTMTGGKAPRRRVSQGKPSAAEDSRNLQLERRQANAAARAFAEASKRARQPGPWKQADVIETFALKCIERRQQEGRDQQR